MNEFTQEPVVFLNETDSSYDVGAGIIFHKSGVYEVSIVGNRTIISEVPKRKKGKWVKWGSRYKCNQCNLTNEYKKPFCPNCGADMRGEQDAVN